MIGVLRMKVAIRIALFGLFFDSMARRWPVAGLVGVRRIQNRIRLKAADNGGRLQGMGRRSVVPVAAGLRGIPASTCVLAHVPAGRCGAPQFPANLRSALRRRARLSRTLHSTECFPAMSAVRPGDVDVMQEQGDLPIGQATGKEPLEEIEVLVNDNTCGLVGSPSKVRAALPSAVSSSL